MGNLYDLRYQEFHLSIFLGGGGFDVSNVSIVLLEVICICL